MAINELFKQLQVKAQITLDCQHRSTSEDEESFILFETTLRLKNRHRAIYNKIMALEDRGCLNDSGCEWYVSDVKFKLKYEVTDQ